MNTGEGRRSEATAALRSEGREERSRDCVSRTFLDSLRSSAPPAYLDLPQDSLCSSYPLTTFHSSLRSSPLAPRRRNKVISLTGSSYAVFKFNADFDLLVENNKYCENWLELDVLDLDLNEVVGVSHFSLRYVRGETQGSFRSSVFANFKTPEQEPIGDVYVDYLVVHPFVLTGLGLPTKSPRMDTCFRKYWTGIHNSNRETLDIGHRGLGRSYARVAEQAEIRENTLLSFSEAGKQGAEYVELDIMLTKDRIPVVFHDFDIGVKGEAKGFKSSTRLSKANLGEMATRDQQSLAVYIAQLTLEQLKVRGGEKRSDNKNNTPPLFAKFLQLVASLLAHTAYSHNQPPSAHRRLSRLLVPTLRSLLRTRSQ